MSYQLDLEKSGKPTIEMPPLPQEESNPETVETLESLSDSQGQSEEVSQEEPVVQVKSKIPEENLRQLRLKAERADRVEQERDALLEEIRRYKNPEVPQQEEEDYSLNLAPDDLAEGKHLTKMERKVRQLEKKLIEQQQQTHAMAVETRLKTQYPDFDAIVNKDNLELLKHRKPHIFNSIQYNPDMYSKAVAAYDAIKDSGLMEELKSYQQEKESVLKNSVKPRPVSSIGAQHGDSPLSRANAFASGLTDDLKKQLHKEMLEAMKSR